MAADPPSTQSSLPPPPSSSASSPGGRRKVSISLNSKLADLRQPSSAVSNVDDNLLSYDPSIDSDPKTSARFHLPKTPGMPNESPTSGGATGGGDKADDDDDKVDAEEVPPEVELTKLAMRVAVMEKAATMMGKLSFLWATVVILGGFASISKKIDFAFVTAILLMEGFRIFVRSHEVELQHQGSGNVTIFVGRIFQSLNRALSIVNPTSFNNRDSGSSSFSTSRSKRGGGGGEAQQKTHKLGSARHSFSRVSFLPFLPSLFRARRVTRVLYALEVSAALISIALSVDRLLHNHDFVDFTLTAPGTTSFNQRFSLFIFYSLTIVEALLFLLGRAYWHYKMKIRNILQLTNENCGLHHHDRHCHTLRRFFYDVYGKCLEGSVFDGLRMDLVDYALRWLHSDGPDAHKEHLLGLKALLAMASAKDSGMRRRTVEAILTSSEGAVERLLDMITWRDKKQSLIREAAAQLLSKFVKDSLASVRVGAVSGSVEAIAGLLSIDDDDDAGGRARDGAIDHRIIRISDDAGNGRPERFNGRLEGLGLRILIKLAYRNEVNSAKVGATRGLLATIISLINITNPRSAPRLHRPSAADGPQHPNTNQIAAGDSHDDEEDDILLLSLTLLSNLASCNGLAGKTLRHDITSVVVCIPYLRDILRYGHGHHAYGGSNSQSDEILNYKQLAADILSDLATDEAGQEAEREVISSTGGIMHALFTLFLADLDGTATQSSSAAGTGAATSTTIRERSRSSRLRVARLRLATTAGRTLSLLSLHNERNCGRMLRVRLPEVLQRHQLEELDVGRCDAKWSPRKVDVVDALMDKVGEEERGHLALFILRNIWDGVEIEEGGGNYRRRIAAATPQVLRLAVDETTLPTIREAAIGLVAKTLATSLDDSAAGGNCTTASTLDHVLREVGTNRAGIVEMVVQLLETYKGASIMKLPRLRRACLELAIALIDVDASAFVALFREKEFGRHIHNISATTSNLENFATFSGNIGLSRHSHTMEDLLSIVAQKLQLQNKLYT